MFTLRRVLVGLGVAFSVYLTLRALLWTAEPEQPIAIIAWTIVIAAIIAACLFADDGDGILPMSVACAAVAVICAAPTGIAIAAGPDDRTEPHATVYIGSIGVLLVIICVRGRMSAALIGLAALTAGSMAWLGPVGALSLGLVGSAVWVAVAALLIRLLDRARSDTERFAALERESVAARSAQLIRRRERRLRVRHALRVAGPILAQAVESGGRLSDDLREQARLAEGELRDELRGGGLLDETVREHIRAARARGAQVTVFDEGGLAGLDEATLVRVRAELAEALAASSSSRLIIRTAPDERVAATVVGRAGDDVDTWVEIAR